MQELTAQLERSLPGCVAVIDQKTNLDSLLGQAFRSLRKLGLRNEAGRLLQRLTELIQKHSAFQAKTARGHVADGIRQRLLLQVAGGYFYFGQENLARPLLDEARAQLFQKDNQDRIQQTGLACAYVSAVAQAPLELCWPASWSPSQGGRRPRHLHDAEPLFPGPSHARGDDAAGPGQR